MTIERFFTVEFIANPQEHVARPDDWQVGNNTAFFAATVTNVTLAAKVRVE